MVTDRRRAQERPDEQARRDYWCREMEGAHEFMSRVMDHPVAECGEPVVSLPEAARRADVEVEFSGRPHAHGGPRLFLLRKGLLEPFLAAARKMNERGWLLRVEDGYRTPEMQRRLALRPETFDAVLRRVLWEQQGELPEPEFVFRRLSVLVATRPKIGTHMSASALDISVLERDTGEEVDRGGPYLEMSELTPMDSPFVSSTARRNRRAITDLMRRHGFVAYPWEFWHYSSGDAFGAILAGSDRPARYGAVSAAPPTGETSRLEDPCARLNPHEEIREQIAAALRRIEGLE